MSFKKNLANYITSLRIIGTLCIVFLTPLTPLYFVIYTITGVTDVLDGLISRLTHTTSEFGARLDSIADLLFYTVSLVKLLPVLIDILPSFIWIIVALIMSLRILSYIIAAVKLNRFASRHSIPNKITGVLVFAVPYFLVSPADVVYCFIVCFAGLFSTLEDLYAHITAKAVTE